VERSRVDLRDPASPLPPVHPTLAIAPLVCLGVFDFPPELEALLRYGRGVDTRRLTDSSFNYRYTSAGAVERFGCGLRLRRSTGRRPVSYTYEHDVEQFFRHSPSVVQAGDG
jgi:UDP-glucose 4-epimerase